MIAQVARSGSKSGQARGRTRVEDTRGGIPCWVGWTDGWLPGLAIFEHVTGIRDRNASVGSPSATRPWATSAKPPEPHMGPALRLPPQLAERADDLAPFKARDDGRVAGSSIHRWLQRHPRFTLHFTPTYSCWLNLVERWFAEVTTKWLTRFGAHRRPPRDREDASQPDRNRDPQGRAVLRARAAA